MARRLVIPDNRAIKNLKGESEAKSKSFPGLRRRRKISADLSLLYSFLFLAREKKKKANNNNRFIKSIVSLQIHISISEV